MRTISLTAVEGIPMVKAGDDLAALIAKGLADTGCKLRGRRYSRRVSEGSLEI